MQGRASLLLRMSVNTPETAGLPGVVGSGVTEKKFGTYGKLRLLTGLHLSGFYLRGKQ